MAKGGIGGERAEERTPRALELRGARTRTLGVGLQAGQSPGLRAVRARLKEHSKVAAQYDLR